MGEWFWDPARNAPVWWAQILISTASGAALGALLTLGGRLIVGTFTRRKISIQGRWNLYTCTFKNGYEYVAYSTEIKKGWLGITKVEIRAGDKIVYKGIVRDERGHLIFELGSTARDQPETVYQRYVGAVGTTERMFGLWLSYDYKTHVASGASILTKGPLTSVELRKIVKDHYGTSDDHGMIRIK